MFLLLKGSYLGVELPLTLCLTFRGTSRTILDCYQLCVCVIPVPPGLVIAGLLYYIRPL